MSDPYLITGPALISFSGGRTSGYMLHQIIQAHGGKLPDDVVVAFANTGKERLETLRFVHECESRWSVKIHWLEWRDTAEGFEEVGFNSASRKGEPFAALIAKKQRLPNWKERWCTEKLKVSVLQLFAASVGFIPGAYQEVIGLRYDEGMRVLKNLHNAQFRKHRKTKKEVPRVPARLVAHPLSKAKVDKAAVLAFWKEQDFDLGLEPWEGNCDLCFLKGRGIRKRIIRDNPDAAPWWSAFENKHVGLQKRSWFDRRDSVAGLVEEVRRSPMFLEDDMEEYDVECGLHCGGDE